MENKKSILKQTLYSLGVISVAGLSYWQGHKVGLDKGYNQALQDSEIRKIEIGTIKSGLDLEVTSVGAEIYHLNRTMPTTMFAYKEKDKTVFLPHAPTSRPISSLEKAVACNKKTEVECFDKSSFGGW